MGERKDPISTKSYAFAVKIVNQYRHLTATKNEYVLSKQLLRSGTSVGANVREGQEAQSKTDFISKFSISLKEVSETLYWLDLLHDTAYLTDEEYSILYTDAVELKRLLTAIVKTSKTRL